MSPVCSEMRPRTLDAIAEVYVLRDEEKWYVWRYMDSPAILGVDLRPITDSNNGGPQPERSAQAAKQILREYGLYDGTWLMVEYEEAGLCPTLTLIFCSPGTCARRLLAFDWNGISIQLLGQLRTSK